MAITLNGTTGITTPDVDSTDLTATGNFTSRGIDDNATSTAMTLDSSGNLLVGTTSTSGFQTSSSATGTIAYTGGAIASNVSGDAPLYLNRLTSDGAIATFRKDGTTVGSIGVRDGDNLYITGGTGSTKGIFLNDNTLGPAATTTGAGSDATTNLGASTIRFKDLYLSGGVYLGGTGAANKLDDYEEGTWTPSFHAHTTNNWTYAVQTGTYTKIGRQVTINVNLRISSKGSSAGNISVANLPFTVADTLASTALEANGLVGYWSASNGTIYSMSMLPDTNATNRAEMYIVDGTFESVRLIAADMDNTFQIRASATYFTNS